MYFSETSIITTSAMNADRFIRLYSEPFDIASIVSYSVFHGYATCLLKTEKSLNCKNMLKNKERVKKVAEFVVNHFKENVEPMGYKAFLVAVDREACTMYKKELDKLLPKDYSEVVYSPAQNDREELTKYYLSEEEEKRVRKDFRNPEKKPKYS